MSEFDIFIFGLNHKVAPVELREKVAFNESEIPDILIQLVTKLEFSEACILSTCNRSEIYVAAPSTEDVPFRLKSLLIGLRDGISDADFEHFYFLRGEDAVQHLFAVTSGLNSMILGEPQITGQVKDAFRIASETGTISTQLQRFFDSALQTAKRVRTETEIASGAVSVAYAAVELSQKIFRDLGKQQVLLIGSGETGQLAARHLKKKGVGKIFIANRTFEKAQNLAKELDGQAFPFPLMKELLPQIDLVIGATYAPEFVLTKNDFKKILPCRSPKPLFMIDIAVPRNFDPEIKQYENIFLNDMDSLQKIVEGNLSRRQQEVQAAQRIIHQEMLKFRQWRQSLNLTPTIVCLRKKLEEIRDVELKKYQHRSSPQELEMIEQATRGLMNKILHLPLSQLRRYGNGTQESQQRINVVREMFDLTDEHYEQ